MPGEDIRNARRIVVLIDVDGDERRYWEVANIGVASWSISGMDEFGARGRLVVEGSFYRQRKNNDSLVLEAKMNAALELTADNMRELGE